MNHTIPRFFFPFGKPISHVEQDQRQRKIVAIVKHIYGNREFLTESQFVAVTKTCGLPRYMNTSFFRRVISTSQEYHITYTQFVNAWMTISKDRYDEESLYFSILQKTNHNFHYQQQLHPLAEWLSPEDFLPVLEDIVLNHPGLQFLSDNPMFQERYIETVICRLFYDAECPSGKMSLRQFKKSKFTERIKSLGTTTELNNTFDCFSYKHFYVMYCKFWALDHDHDLMISDIDLMNYNNHCLTPRIVRRIVQHGRITAFAKETPTNRLSFLDFIWFLLNEVDKTSTKAIEYWFRCMDEDEDGILSSYELETYWQDQIDRQLLHSSSQYQYQYQQGDNMNEDWVDEDLIRFEDILCQMNDLIQPKQPGQFTLHDLKRNGYLAERFFDTFLHFDKFQVHESHQGCIRVKLQQGLQQHEGDTNNQQHPISLLYGGSEHLDNLSEGGLLVGDWSIYAEMEYQQLLSSQHQEASSFQRQQEENDSEEEDDADVHDSGDEYNLPSESSQLQFNEYPGHVPNEHGAHHTVHDAHGHNGAMLQPPQQQQTNETFSSALASTSSIIYTPIVATDHYHQQHPQHSQHYHWEEGKSGNESSMCIDNRLLRHPTSDQEEESDSAPSTPTSENQESQTILLSQQTSPPSQSSSPPSSSSTTADWIWWMSRQRMIDSMSQP